MMPKSRSINQMKSLSIDDNKGAQLINPIMMTIFGNKSESISKIQMEMFSESNELSRMKAEAIQDIPPRIDSIRAVLSFPQVQKAFRHLLNYRMYSFKRLALFKWLKVVENIRLLRIEQERIIRKVRIIQFGWLAYKKRKQDKISMEENLRYLSIVLLQSFFRCYIYKRKYNILKVRKRTVLENQRQKKAIIIQKFFRGFLTRAFISNQQRVLLHIELRDWANGSALKLYDRKALQAATSRSLIHDAIDVALTSSRPLHLRPPWQQIYRIRKFVPATAAHNSHITSSSLQALFDLRYEEERSNAETSAEYVHRLYERSQMRREDERERFLLYRKILLKEIRRNVEEKRQQRAEMLQKEYEHQAQKRRAEELLSWSTENRLAERRERELMFREELLKRRVDAVLAAREWAVRSSETEMMGREEGLTRTFLVAVARLAREAAERKEHQERVRSAKMAGDLMWGEGGQTVGTTILERRYRRWSEMRADDVVRDGWGISSLGVSPVNGSGGTSDVFGRVGIPETTLGIIDHTNDHGEARKGLKRIGVGEKYWWRDSHQKWMDGDFHIHDMGWIEDFFHKSAATVLLREGREFAATLNQIGLPVELGQKASILHTRLLVQKKRPRFRVVRDVLEPVSTYLRMTVALEKRCLERCLLLSRYRRIELSRASCYRRLCTVLVRFESAHCELTTCRSRLLKDKFSSRQQRKQVLDRAIELECQLSFYKDEIVGNEMQLRELIHEEVEIFAELFRFEIQEKVVFSDYISTADGVGRDSSALSEADFLHYLRRKSEKASQYEEMRRYCLQNPDDTMVHRKETFIILKYLFKGPNDEQRDTSAGAWSWSPTTRRLLKQLLDSHSDESLTAGHPNVSRRRRANGFPGIPNTKMKQFANPSPSKSSNCPGFSKFIERHHSHFEFFGSGQRTRSWSARVLAWLSLRKRDWKDAFHTELLGCAQRFLWLSGLRGAVNDNEYTVPRLITEADAVDLFEVLLCRLQLHIEVLGDSKGDTVVLEIDSHECERRFGMHPASALARLLVLKTVYKEQIQKPSEYQQDETEPRNRKSSELSKKRDDADMDKRSGKPKGKHTVQKRNLLKLLSSSNRVAAAESVAENSDDGANIKIVSPQKKEKVDSNTRSSQILYSQPLKGRSSSIVVARRPSYMIPGSNSRQTILPHQNPRDKTDSNSETAPTTRGSIFKKEDHGLLYTTTVPSRKFAKPTSRPLHSKTNKKVQNKSKHLAAKLVSDESPEDDLLDQLSKKRDETKSSADLAQNNLQKKLLLELDKLCNNMRKRCISDIVRLVSHPKLLTAAVERENEVLCELMDVLLQSNHFTLKHVTVSSQRDSHKILRQTLQLSRLSLSPANFIRFEINSQRWDARFPSWMHPVYHWGEIAPPREAWQWRHNKPKTAKEAYNTFLETEMSIDRIATALRDNYVKRVNYSRKKNAELWRDAERDRMVREDALSWLVRDDAHQREIVQQQISHSKSLIEWFRSLFCAGNAGAVLETHDPSLESKRIQMKNISKSVSLRWPHVRIPILPNGSVKFLTSNSDSSLKSSSWLTGEPMTSFEKSLQLDSDRKDHTYLPPRDYSVNVKESWVAGGLDTVLVVTRVVTDARINSRGHSMVEVIAKSTGRRSIQCFSARIGFLDRPICKNDGRQFAIVTASKSHSLCEKCARLVQDRVAVMDELPATQSLQRDLIADFLSQRYDSSKVMAALIALQRKWRKKYKLKK